MGVLTAPHTRHPKAWLWDPRVCLRTYTLAQRDSWMARPSLAMTEWRASSRVSASCASQPLRVALAGAVRVVGERRREVRVAVGMIMCVPMIVVMSVIAMRMIVVVIMVMVIAVMMVLSIMIMVIVVMPIMVMRMAMIVPVRRAGANTLHVVMVALLHAPHLGLVADRLLAVFA